MLYRFFLLLEANLWFVANLNVVYTVNVLLFTFRTGSRDIGHQSVIFHNVRVAQQALRRFCEVLLTVLLTGTVNKHT